MEIQQEVTKQGERGTASRVFHAKVDKEKIATWRTNLNRILLVFNVHPITPYAANIKDSSPG